MKKIAALALVCFLAPCGVSAAVIFTEVQYNPAGTDTGHEWVEIQNTGASSIDLTGWKFGDASSLNHTIFSPTDQTHPGQGSLSIPANGFAVLAGDATQFLADFPSFTGTVLDTTLDLKNSATTISLRSESNGAAQAQLTYQVLDDADDTGKSLQLTSGGSWVAAQPTPGAAYASVSTGGGSSTSAVTSGVPAGGSTAQTKTDVSGTAVPAHLAAFIDAPLTVTQGTEISFVPKVIGYMNETRGSGQFSIAFGDGQGVMLERPEKVTHVYTYPGTYMLVLNYRTNKFITEPEVTARRTIHVNTQSVTLSRDTSGVYILTNTSSDDTLDLTGWTLGDGLQSVFVFPEGTELAPSASLRVPMATTDASLQLYSKKGVMLARVAEEASVQNIVQEVSPTARVVPRYTPLPSETDSIVPQLGARVTSADTGSPLGVFLLGLVGLVAAALVALYRFGVFAGLSQIAKSTTDAQSPEALAETIQILDDTSDDED